MIPAILLVLVSAVLVTAFCLRRLIDPTCPACTGRVWQNTPNVLRCARCGWSTGGSIQEPRPMEDLRAA